MERAVVADHERHARAGKAFNMHRIRLSAGAPHGLITMGTNKRCLSKLASQKGTQGLAGASEALRLCKFRASVPSGSPLFLLSYCDGARSAHSGLAVSAPHMGVCRASGPVGLFVLSVRFGPGSVLHAVRFFTPTA